MVGPPVRDNCDHSRRRIIAKDSHPRYAWKPRILWIRHHRLATGRNGDDLAELNALAAEIARTSAAEVQS